MAPTLPLAGRNYRGQFIKFQGSPCIPANRFRVCRDDTDRSVVGGDFAECPRPIIG